MFLCEISLEVPSLGFLWFEVDLIEKNLIEPK